LLVIKKIILLFLAGLILFSETRNLVTVDYFQVSEQQGEGLIATVKQTDLTEFQRTRRFSVH